MPASGVPRVPKVIYRTAVVDDGVPGVTLMNGKVANLLIVLFVLSMLLPAPSLGEDGRGPLVVDAFASGITNATFGFVGQLWNDSLAVELPRGSTVVSAALTIEGIEGTVLPSTLIDFANTKVGKDLWAKWSEGQGLYPPKVDPYNSKWNAPALIEYQAVAKSDDTPWKTETTDAGRPPYAWPIQLYHINPALAGVQELTVMWEGMSSCSFNTTHDYHCELWLRDHVGLDWEMVASYSSDTDDDVWLNHTFAMPSDYYSANGSVDLAVVGIHSQWAGPMLPAFDVGHLYSDYVALRANTTGSTEYPSDVGLDVGGHAVQLPSGVLKGELALGEAHGLRAAVQSAIDDAVVEPGNLTLPFNISVGASTAGRLRVGGLRIEYEPPVNLPPEWRGPERVELEEDSPAAEVLDLDASFADDHNTGLLTFGLLEVDAVIFAAVARGASGNDTLEVRSMPDFFGDAWVKIKATDRFGACATVDLKVRILQVPDRPALEALGELHADERVPFYYMVAATDVDLPDDRLTFADDSPAFDIDPATGEIMWTPMPSQIGRHEVLVTVTDVYGLSDTRLITIVVSNSNDAPRITSPLELAATQGETMSYIIRADDPDVPFGDHLLFSAFAETLELEVDGLTGTLTFTPTNAEVPSFIVTLRVQDTIGTTDEKPLVVSVENVNDPPGWVEPGTLTFDQGDQVVHRLIATDPDTGIDTPVREHLTYSSQGLVALQADVDGWVNFSADATMVGEHEATYTVRDAKGLSDTMTVTWVIRNVNDPPVLVGETPTRLDATEDSTFTFTLGAMDADGDALAWSDDTGLFDIGAGDGTISFTPRQADVGTHRMNVTISDGQGGTLVVSLQVVVANVNDPPVANITRPAEGARIPEGSALELEATATDEDGDALEYTWKEGSRVLGTGRTLTVRGLDAGRHVITLTVTDGGATVTESIAVEVEGGAAGGNTMVYIAIAVVAVVAALVAVLLVRRRAQGGGPVTTLAPQDEAAQGVGPPPQT